MNDEPASKSSTTPDVSLETTPKKRRKLFNSPRSARRHYDNAIEKMNDLKRKLLFARTENYKLKRKITKLEDLVLHLKNKNLISVNAEATLLV